MRLIDADALIKHLDDAIKDAKRNGELCDYWEDDRSNLLYYLDNAPTVDAVPVVRYREERVMRTRELYKQIQDKRKEISEERESISKSARLSLINWVIDLIDECLEPPED